MRQAKNQIEEGPLNYFLPDPVNNLQKGKSGPAVLYTMT